MNIEEALKQADIDLSIVRYTIHGLTSRSDWSARILRNTVDNLMSSVISTFKYKPYHPVTLEHLFSMYSTIVDTTIDFNAIKCLDDGTDDIQLDKLVLAHKEAEDLRDEVKQILLQQIISERKHNGEGVAPNQCELSTLMRFMVAGDAINFECTKSDKFFKSIKKARKTALKDRETFKVYNTDIKVYSGSFKVNKIPVSVTLILTGDNKIVQCVVVRLA